MPALPDYWLAGGFKALCLGLALEVLLGEPRRWHALVGFGRLAELLEARLNHGSARILRGLLAWSLLLVGALGLFAGVKCLLGGWGWITDGAALWFALGARSLWAHVRAIIIPLQAGDLPAARRAVSLIVSRDCSQLDEAGVCKAALESTLENGADAIFATLFWFAVLGGWGVILHRLANTLDAMWGYRMPRFNLFGRVAARADDVLNYLPARLTALSYALFGHTRLALTAWHQQAPHWDSPNAGPVMASGAGALGISLGGAAVYHGKSEVRPVLGFGPAPQVADLLRGLRLLQWSLCLWILTLVVLCR